MSQTPESQHNPNMTLAFDLPAFTALLQPRSAYFDAKQWSQYVGVVGDDPAAVEAAVVGRGIHQDFEVGEYDKQSTLSRLQWEADTDRYVLIGTDDAARDLAAYVGWDYLPLEDAASRAGWTLRENATLIDHLKAKLGTVSWVLRHLT